ncbi:hypothetical protein HGD85_04175 [Rhodobacteraceae bacterium R_SAG10]|nr:hypothetical protein [Rhodobacteraceae bacterium R_SAG10]
MLLRKRLERKTAEAADVGLRLIEKARALFLREPHETYSMYSAAMVKVVTETGDKFGISFENALRGDGLKWRQLARAKDDLEVVGVHAFRMRISSKSSAGNLGMTMGTAYSLLMTTYMLKFQIQQFPEMSAEQTNRGYRYAVSLMERLCGIDRLCLSPEDFWSWLEENRP